MSFSYTFNMNMTVQATIKGMTFDEWGDPGTTYKALYVRKKNAANSIVDSEMKLARKARPPNSRLAGTFWVRTQWKIVSLLLRQCCQTVFVICWKK
jgi:hypothetical protein